MRADGVDAVEGIETMKAAARRSPGGLFLASLVSALFGSGASGPPRRILVLRTSRLGDFICALPALNHLRRTHPGARIVLLTSATTNRRLPSTNRRPEWLGLLSPGVVDDIVYFKRDDLYSARGLGRLRSKIRELAPELTLILPFTGNNVRAGLAKSVFLRALGVKSNVFGWKVKDRKADGGGGYHQVLAALDALSEAGMPCPEEDIVFDVHIDETARSYVDALWADAGLDGRDVVAIFPGGTYAHKRWPAMNFASLCRTLRGEYGVEFIVVGGTDERDLGEEVASAIGGGASNLAGRTSLMATAEVLMRCRLVVGNDSGVSHLASAVDTPVVTVFPAIHPPGIWEPWNSRDLAVRADAACANCGSEETCASGTFECIRGVAIEGVLDKCRKVLDGTRSTEETAEARIRQGAGEDAGSSLCMEAAHD
jgi:ADP-heptose:LPS heptosyltransferase